jgi:hypothetical protein
MSALTSTLASEGDRVSSGTSIRLFGRGFRREDDPTADVTMLTFLLSTLEVRAVSIEARVQTDPDKKLIVERVKEALSALAAQNLVQRGHESWNDAYKLERMLALAEPSDTLMRETQRRIDEAAEDNVLAAARLQNRFDEIVKNEFGNDPPNKPLSPAGEINLRNLLQDVLEWHHWSSQRTFCLRPMQRVATNRIVASEVAAFALVVAPFALLYLFQYFLGRSPAFHYWSGLPLYLTLTAGLFGAFFSRMQWLQSNRETLSISQVRDAMDWRAIQLRGAVGMGGALIVYFFLQSGLVGGDLFPKFSEFGVVEGWTPDPLHAAKDGPGEISVHLFNPTSALALLIVWSFIAGFSERFVPGILSATETSLTNAASNQPK